jgi:minor extracellular serine protease Vpr
MKSMKVFTTLVTVMAACALPSVAQLTSAQKTPYYRGRVASKSAPRQNSATAIVNAASFVEGISPGELATIFGENLTHVNGVVLAQTNPLPTRLAGVQVFVSGIPAPLYAIAYANGEDQISIQVPYDAPTGPGAAEIQVLDEGFTVADFFADSFTEDPGIFVYNGNYAIAEASDYSLIGPDNPAFAGEPLVLYVTGLGPLNLRLVDGYGSPTSPPLAETVDPFQVILDNETCSVFFSGLAPGFVGLYQVNFYVPRDAAAGNVQIYIQSPYATSAVAILPVR